MQNVKGTVLWYAQTAADNVGNIGHTLRDYYWKYPALPPLMTFLDHKSPKDVRCLKLKWTEQGPILKWKTPKGKKWGDVSNKFVVYQFKEGEPIDLNDASKIMKITYDHNVKVPYIKDGKTTYIVTALDRVGNESKGKKKKIKF